MNKKNELSTLSKGVLSEASEIAASYNSENIDVIDLAIALLGGDFDSPLIPELEELGENSYFLKESLITLKGDKLKTKRKKISYSKNLEAIIEKSKEIAAKFDVEIDGQKFKEKASPIHLFVSMLNSEETWLDDIFEDKESLSKDLVSLFNSHFIFGVNVDGTHTTANEEGEGFEGFYIESSENLENTQEEALDIGDGARNAIKKMSGSPLARFAVNLTQVSDSLDKVIGRKEELDLIAETLLQKNKPNPILVGESGVGKTAIVEGFVKNLKDSNSILRNSMIYDLNIPSMVAGTKYRGEFEQRIEAVIKEVTQKNNSGQNIILFIDEFHMVVGSGKTDGGNIDGGNILKTALARGDVKCIGATTPKEYKASIEKDSALERRFVRINIDEPSEEETIEILKKSKKRFEEHHNVFYSDSLIETIVFLSGKFITNQNFPDKAFSILDNVGARKINKTFSFPKEVLSCDDELERLLNDEEYINTFSENQEAYFDSIKELSEKKVTVLQKYLKKYEKKIEVTEEDVAESISAKSGVPKEMILKSQKRSLANLEKDILKDVFGQDEAVKAVCDAIKVSYFGLNEVGKPTSFLFDGASGVGKTFLAKKLAENVFGSEGKLIKIDMSEYSSETSVSKLVGADPGYIGFESGSELIEAVRKDPYSVILLDELEKSHDKAKNLLLQVMNDGVLTDSAGRKADFSNCIIIMTSNAGSKVESSTAGFGSKFDHVKSQKESSQKESSLKKHFSPEFISRITSIQYFNQLTEEDLIKIVRANLDKIKDFLINQKGIRLKYTKKLLDFLIKNDTIQVGARQALNRVENNFKTKLVNFVLSKGNDIQSISATEKDGDFAFSLTKNRKKVKK